jgi:biofilm protein TabA
MFNLNLCIYFYLNLYICKRRKVISDFCDKIITMIVDSIDKFTEYFNGMGIQEFLDDLVPGTPDGKYEIDGENIFAIISSYDTSPRLQRKPEAHREYVDIQILLSGREIIEWYPLEGLKVDLQYDESKDVGFYDLPDTPKASVVLEPGIFAVFFPHDAHMPQVAPEDKSEPVLKAVIKLKASLL